MFYFRNFLAKNRAKFVTSLKLPPVLSAGVCTKISQQATSSGEHCCLFDRFPDVVVTFRESIPAPILLPLNLLVRP